MDDYKAEKRLAICYPLIIGLSLICSVTSAIAWNHWKFVLDHCIERNCGCFLYGESSRLSFYFVGGHVSFCHFAVYGLAIPIIFGIMFGCFHVYRACIKTGKRKTGTHTVQQRSGDIVVVTAQSELTDSDVSYQYWITTSVISTLMFFYTLLYASLYTDGFLQTCREYRSELVKIMIAGGNTVAAIRGRISCGAVFDFMDYLHLDITPERIRDGRINSGACYYLAIVSSWISVLLWLIIVIINIQFARQSRVVRV